MDSCIIGRAVSGEIGMVVITLLGIVIGTSLYVVMRWLYSWDARKWR